MASLTLNSIILAGLVMAFVLPALATISSTLPSPFSGNTVELAEQFNATGLYIQTQFNATVTSFNTTLMNPNNGSFYANPTIFQAFAFMIQGLGSIMTIVVQIPYLDFVSMNFMIMGMSSVLPGVPLGFIQGGSTFLYWYMGISMMLMGISAVLKYNVKEG